MESYIQVIIYFLSANQVCVRLISIDKITVEKLLLLKSKSQRKVKGDFCKYDDELQELKLLEESIDATTIDEEFIVYETFIFYESAISSFQNKFEWK